MKKIITLLVAVLVLLGAIGFASGEATLEPEEERILDFGAVSALEKEALTLEEMLGYAMQDEYLARQEYALIMEAYGDQQPFSNIVNAEESHMQFLTELYEKYNLKIPEDTSSQYAVLPESLEAAMAIGVKAEVDNIAMYEKFLAYDLPDDVRDVFSELKSGSENHLTAFDKGERGTGNGAGDGEGSKNGNGAGDGEGTGNTDGQGAGTGEAQGNGKGAAQGTGQAAQYADQNAGEDPGQGAGQETGNGAGNGTGTSAGQGAGDGAGQGAGQGSGSGAGQGAGKGKGN